MAGTLEYNWSMVKVRGLMTSDETSGKVMRSDLVTIAWLMDVASSGPPLSNAMGALV
jgi:hypothetical protein